jgi:hypothetical protein
MVWERRFGVLGVERPYAEFRDARHAVQEVQGAIVTQHRTKQSLAIQDGELSMSREEIVALFGGNASKTA